MGTAWRLGERCCCTDRWVGRSTSQLHPTLCDADGDRAAQVQHVVQDMNRDGNLSDTTLVLTTAQPVADARLVAPDGGLDPAAFGVARHLLLADPTCLGNTVQMAAARCGLG